MFRCFVSLLLLVMASRYELLQVAAILLVYFFAVVAQDNARPYDRELVDSLPTEPRIESTEIETCRTTPPKQIRSSKTTSPLRMRRLRNPKGVLAWALLLLRWPLLASSLGR